VFAGMPIPRRVCLVIFLVVVWAVLPLSQRAFPQQLRKVRYGLTVSPSHLPIWVAKEAGLFAKYNLELEPIHIRGGALITMAIMSGGLQFSGAGAESVVAARVQGGDVVLLACPVDTDPVYLVARPEISSPRQLKGRATAVTRLGSTTHFHLRAALKFAGLDPEKDLTILQLGSGGDIAMALDSGRISAAALTFRFALPFITRGWPVLVDLTKTDFAYPSSCVTSSRAFVRAEPKLVENFLRAYVRGIELTKKDPAFAAQVLSKAYQENDMTLAKKTVEAYSPLFKSAPYVPDSGIETVLNELAARRSVPAEFIGHAELFRDNRPLEAVLAER
jgi:NitT/TauT family transport system substrate-binding protein